MDALRFELSSSSLASSAVVTSSLLSHSRHSFSSVQLGRFGSSPAIGSVAKTAANEICTADELHYVPVPNSDWRVALWRYLPSPKAPKRNHPLLLLSGIATNAFTYDLSPESSFARFMSGSGFDTWILELRGAGLSSLSVDTDLEKPRRTESRNDKRRIVSDLLENLIDVSERMENVLDGGFKILGLQDRLSKRVEDFKRRLELIPRYNWDFDNYLEEDIPSAMEYVRSQSKPKDGKLLAIGHSMGGILLYAMLSRCGFKGMDSGFASVTTLASTLDYSSSGTLLKYILPVKEPAQALNLPALPIDTMLAMVHPLMFRPPYALSWLTANISAQMMDPELIEKLVLNSLCTVPTKLIYQLATAVDQGGLRDRTGTFYYKDHIGKTNVPILALAGDWDIICPPDAVYDTVKLIPEHLATFKVIGSPGGPHYGHQDMIAGRMARSDIYPLIVKFLQRHDESETTREISNGF